MRLAVEVEIGGNHLIDNETGVGELGRILLTAATMVEDGRVLDAGDSVALQDYNGVTVGRLSLVPDWAEGDQVWVTSDSGALVEAGVVAVQAMPDGYWSVATRARYTDEVLAGVIVDHHGRDHLGKPRLGLRR